MLFSLVFVQLTLSDLFTLYEAPAAPQFLDSITPGTSLQPIILVPGIAGSRLQYSKNNKKWKTFWLNLLDVIPTNIPGVFKAFKAYYDEESDTYSNTDGLYVQPEDFGGLNGVRYLEPHLKERAGGFCTLITALEKRGYVEGENLFGAPYDWRLATAPQLKRSGMAQKFIELVQTAYERNNNQKVHLLGHSMGCCFIHQILTNHVTPEWRQKYVASFIAACGPLAGAVEAYTDYLSYHKWGTLPIPGSFIYSTLQNFGSMYWLTPTMNGFPKTKRLATIKRDGQDDLIITMENMTYPFESTGRTKQLAAMTRTLEVTSKMEPPRVPTYVIYSNGTDTIDSVVINAKKKKEWWTVTSENVWGDGDGAVPIGSLKYALSWANEQDEPLYEVHFPNYEHTELIHSEVFIEKVLSIISA